VSSLSSKMSVEIRGPSGVPVQIGPEVGGRSDCRGGPTGTAGGGEVTKPGCLLADFGGRFPGKRLSGGTDEERGCS